MTTTPDLHQVTAAERTEMRARHKPAKHRCELDGQPWPCDATRLLLLAETVNVFCVTWRETFMVMPDDYGMTMQCDEAEAAAALYRALGRTSEAESLLDDHAEHDTEEDRHYNRGVLVQQRRSLDGAAGGHPVPGS
jgi:hypothetical protein